MSTKTFRGFAVAAALAVGATALPVASIPTPAQAAPAPVQATPAKATTTAPATTAQQRRARVQAQRLATAQQIITTVGLQQRVRRYLARRDLPVPKLPGVEGQGSCSVKDIELQQWLGAQGDRLSLADRIVLTLTMGQSMPMIESLMATDEKQLPVELTGQGPLLRKNFGQLQSFWDVDRSSTLLLAMDGGVLASQKRLTAVYTKLGLAPQLASTLAGAVSGYVLASPGLDGGRNPVLSFNAFAHDGGPVGEGPAQAPRIAMGVGMLQAMRALGHDDVAPQLVLAHEYGHQVQFVLGHTSDGTVAGTRHEELHADASAGYFVASPRGGRFTAAQQREATEVSYSIGDCMVDSTGHHGTPGERGRAASWGMAQSQRDVTAGVGVQAVRFRSLFDQVLPSLLDPASSTPALAVRR